MPDKPEHLWSKSVTEHDNAAALPPGVFKSADPEKIADALARSARDPARASEDPYRSAMSMLDFYMNRAGRNLSAAEREALEKAKLALRERFGRGAS
jgi:Protein of unknown function (DUF3175)